MNLPRRNPNEENECSLAGESGILTAREVAKLLKVSVGWVTTHASGKYHPVLPAYRLGGMWRFRQSEIEEFLKRAKRAMELGLPLQ